MLGDLGELIVAKGFKKLPKVQKIARSGHTAYAHRMLEWPTKSKIKLIVANINLEVQSCCESFFAECSIDSGCLAGILIYRLCMISPNLKVFASYLSSGKNDTNFFIRGSITPV